MCIHDSPNNFKNRSNDECVLASKSVSLSCEKQWNDDITQNDSKLDDTNFLTGKFFKLQVLDHDDGNHPVGKHSESFGQEKKRKVLSLRWEVNSHLCSEWKIRIIYLKKSNIRIKGTFWQISDFLFISNSNPFSIIIWSIRGHFIVFKCFERNELIV